MRLAPVRRGLAAVAVLGVLVWFVSFGAPPAGAHAVVTGSTPADGQTVAAPPDEVQVTFSERVSSDLGGLTVLNSDGERVDNGDSSVGATGTVLRATVQPDLPDGTYVMNYRVVSADGHPINGAIVFGVGAGTVVDTTGLGDLRAGGDDSGFELAAGIARFVTYAGALLAAGLAVFIVFVHDQRPDRWRLGSVVRIASVVGGIGAVATVALQAALLTGDGLSAMTDVSTLRRALTEGLDWATVVLLFGLACVHLSTDTVKAVVSQALAFYGGLAVVGSFGLWGHSTTVEPRWVAFLADGVHVAAAAVWLGGLVGLGYVLWSRRLGARAPLPRQAPLAVSAVRVESATVGGSSEAPPLPPEPPTAAGGTSGAEDQTDEGVASSTARMVGRFSTLAAGSIVVLAIAGVTLAWKELSGIGDLTSTDYGRVLLAKLVVVGLIVLGGAYNRFRLVPAVEQEEATGGASRDDVRRPWRHLTTSVLVEVAGILVVLGITAALVNITPPKNAEATTTTSAVQEAAVRDATVEVILTPGEVGNNSLHITYFDAGKRPKDVAQQVSVELTNEEQGIGPISREALKAATGHFIVDGLQIPTAGDWELELVTRISDFEQVRTPFTYTVS